MNIYLAIITTVLVLTQIHIQGKAIAKDLAWLKDRAMTDEELAEWIAHPKISYCQYDICDGETDCAVCALKWLKEEVNE